jgi:hypothetical protein
MGALLVNVAIQELPSLIAFFKEAFAQEHPEQPEPTEAEIVAAFQQACASSLARDAQWLAAHPE